MNRLGKETWQTKINIGQMSKNACNNISVANPANYSPLQKKSLPIMQDCEEATERQFSESISVVFYLDALRQGAVWFITSSSVVRNATL